LPGHIANGLGSLVGVLGDEAEKPNDHGLRTTGLAARLVRVFGLVCGANRRFL
jgi:hypothetical protein